jgi:peptidoglycan hydrolase CwlO-like protein
MIIFFKKNFFKIISLLLVIFLIIWVCFVLTPQTRIDEESLKKIDSLNTTIKSIEKEQHKLDSEIVNYNKEVLNLDENITKIKTEKTIIKQIYYEKINSVNNYNVNQLDSFFSNRYNY